MKSSLAKLPKLIRDGAPHLIHSDQQLEAYTEALFQLTRKANLTEEEEEAIDLLTLLVEHYENERYPIPDADAVQVLRFLLERSGLSQRELAADLGGESSVSLILSGKRQLNRDHIARLSRRFKVSPAVFFNA